TTGRHDHIVTGGVRQLRLDLRIRVGAGENDGVGGHALQVFGAEQVRAGQADEDVRTVERIGQGALVGFRGEDRLVLVEIVTTGVDHALAVDHEDVLDLGPHAHQQLHAGDGGGTGTEAD